MLAAAGDDPEIVATARYFLTGRHQLAVEILGDAVAAGVVRGDIEPIVMWESIVSPLHIRAVLGTPASNRTVQQLIDVATNGICATLTNAR